MLSTQDIAQIVLTGVGATAVMDAWLLLLARSGVPTTSFAFIGRWVGHLARGRFAHAAIAKSPPVTFELGLGWLTHYAVGIAYAGLLAGMTRMEALRQPTFLPALAVGVGTLAVPMLVMQPAMGAGFAGSKTAAPFRNGLRTLANHAVFGCGLYVAAVLLQWVTR
jgi:hypothetical protein